ncbi:MAG: aminotransferase class V-fold PLP-dependent enzyme [Lachnospiraceae bacterium]|nr:aminotransferase class V-fold PLP-dependent enzyme [Lachnospiraceae bacterium]
MKESLYKKLENYSNSDYYPFHMPGHKRNMGGREMEEAFHIDITEIDGFDNLHHAEGILRDAMKSASELYHSEETHFLVNGSTCGILSAISATVKKHGKILLARNCHKAAYHAIYLRELEPVYLYPPVQDEYGIFNAVPVEKIEDVLEKNPDIEAVFLTSPTYDGVVSDVASIVRTAHRKKIPVIVDEAHGAHFGFHKDFPENSVALGADMVIHSVHKTLPAFTQTALLHINGDLVDRKKINYFLQVYQTSSPSYLLMAGIDQCISILQQERDSLFEKLSGYMDEFLEKCRTLRNIKIFQQGDADYEFDKSKILLSVKDCPMTGHELAQILLNRYHLQMEMEAPTYVMGIATIMDTQEGFRRLAEALTEIDRELEHRQKNPRGQSEQKQNENDKMFYDLGEAKKIYHLYEIDDMEKETIPLEKSVNRVSVEYIYLYPPGIPIVAPGELMTEHILELINAYKKAHYAVQGPEDYKMEKLSVIK